jgi:hypothetical protein
MFFLHFFVYTPFFHALLGATLPALEKLTSPTAPNSGMAASARSLRPKTCRAPARTSCAPIKLARYCCACHRLRAQTNSGKQWHAFFAEIGSLSVKVVFQLNRSIPSINLKDGRKRFRCFASKAIVSAHAAACEAIVVFFVCRFLVVCALAGCAQGASGSSPCRNR